MLDIQCIYDTYHIWFKLDDSTPILVERNKLVCKNTRTAKCIYFQKYLCILKPYKVEQVEGRRSRGGSLTRDLQVEMLDLEWYRQRGKNE